MACLNWQRIFFPLVLTAGVVLAVIYGVGQYIAHEQMEKNLAVMRPPHEISALVQSGPIIYAGGRDGVFVIDAHSFRLKGKLPGSEQVENVRALLLDKAGNLWIGTQNGLFLYEDDKVLMIKGLPDKRINCLACDNKGRIWVGTWNGAAVLEGSRWRVYGEKDGLASSMVNVIFEDSRGFMWFGSYAVPGGGVSCLAGNEWFNFNSDDGLPDDNVCDIMEDLDGNIWAATGFYNRGGAVLFKVVDGRPQIARRLTQKDGLAGEKVRSIYQDAAGRMWFGSEYDGVAWYDGKRWGYLDRRKGLAGNEVKDMLEDDNGFLWMATEDGLTRMRRGEK